MRASRLFFLVLFSAAYADVVLFTPPHGWQYAHPKVRSQYVSVGFIGDQGSSSFHPSINLAVEEIEISQKEYLKAVKEIHTQDARASWRDLGPFPMKSGTGRLTEISAPSPYGEIKTLQAIFVSGTTAYLLTAAALKKDFPSLQRELLRSLSSLCLHPDLISALPNDAQREKCKELLSTLHPVSEKEEIAILQRLEKRAAQDFSEAGGYWQYLFLLDAHEKLHTSSLLR